VVGEVAHCVAERDEDVEIGKGAADRAPQHRAAAELATGDGFTDGGDGGYCIPSCP
jgi:hypothetical protein